MSAPHLLTAQTTETVVTAVFNQSVISSTGALGAGFTVSVNGVPAPVVSAVYPTGHPEEIALNLGVTIRVGDTTTLAYDATKGNLADSSDTFPVASFVPEVVANYSTCAGLLAAVLALVPDDATTVTLVFSDPVTSSNYLTGLTIKVNGAVVAPLSAAPAGDPRDIKIVFGTLFIPADVLTFSYDDTVGDWKTLGSFPIPSMTDVAISNAANQPSAYPLSTVIREPLVAENGDILATVGIDLCYVDNALVNQYGPAQVDFGGTFGVTISNPTGVFIPQDFKALSAGLEVTKRFSSPGNPGFAQVAASDWLVQITARIGVALGALRVIDNEVVLGAMTIAQV